MFDTASVKSESSNSILNIYQQTSLAISLRELEARLGRIRVLLDLNEFRTRLEPEQISQLRASVDRQQAVIDALFRRFRLPRETIDVVQTLIAELSISWTQLADSRSDKMGRYGDVNPALGPQLDPEIDQLIESCLQMTRTLEQARQE